MPLEINRHVDLTNFPIERARLEVAIPTLAGPLIFLFVIGFCTSSSINTVYVLPIDLFPGKAGTATAAKNLARCWLGAGATSGVVPLINKVGMGWTAVFYGLRLIAFSPLLWHVMKNGPKWRHATKARKERQGKEKRKEKADGGERGQ
jgi:hypothetical protein